MVYVLLLLAGAILATTQAKFDCNQPCSVVSRHPVCGTDGITYQSECELMELSCKRNPSLQIAFQGNCNKNRCYENIKCPEGEVEVCGHDGKTYKSECHLTLAMCLTETAILHVYNGPCHKGSEPRCFLGCPKDFAPVCGSDGRFYDNECMMRKEGCRKNTTISVVSWPETKCKHCPSCGVNAYAPVCASDTRTYTNECIMRAEACLRRKAIMKLYDGKCSL